MMEKADKERNITSMEECESKWRTAKFPHSPTGIFWNCVM